MRVSILNFLDQNPNKTPPAIPLFEEAQAGLFHFSLSNIRAIRPVSAFTSADRESAFPPGQSRSTSDQKAGEWLK